jgi:TetR/AcrR family transcriptional regulator
VKITCRKKSKRGEKRQTILDAAHCVFNEKGIVGATMDDVARAANTSKGSVYLHFRSKDELFMALACQVYDQVIEKFHQILSDEGALDPGETLSALLTSFSQIALEHPSTIRNVFIWFALGDQVDTTSDAFLAYRERVQQIIGSLVATLERGRADKSFHYEGASTMRAMQIWGALIGNLIARINASEVQRRLPETFEPDEILPGIIQLLCSGLACGGHNS